MSQSGTKIKLYFVFVSACLIITIRNNFLNFNTFCESPIFTFLQQFDGEAFDKHFLLFQEENESKWH